MVDLQTDKILITGALGWLGSRLVEALVNGFADQPGLEPPARNLRVRCLVLPDQDAALLRRYADRVEIVPGDIRNGSDCARFCEGSKGALLFHTAGIIHPHRVSEFYEINLMGTTNLLDAAAVADVKRAVIVSSNSPCGCNPHPDHLFDERFPYRPYFNYGRSKMQMELAVQERQRQ